MAQHGGWHRDPRWGPTLDIIKNPLSISSKDLPKNHYTLEFWFKLKHYPLINSINNIERHPVLLRLFYRDHHPHKKVYKSLPLRYGTKQLTIANSINKYQQQEWFQLVIVNGAFNKTAGGGVGKLYINGKMVDQEIPLPDKIHKLVVGNGDDTTGKWKLRHNRHYSDNLLGQVRIYNRALDSYEVQNNYYSAAKNYGLVINRVTKPVSFGLTIKLPMTPRKNSKDNYNRMSTLQIQDLSGLLSQIQTLQTAQQSAPPAPSAPMIMANGKKMECKNVKIRDDGMVFNNDPAKRLQDLKADLLLLNSNPEYFLQMLRNDSNKKDEATIKLMLNQPAATAPAAAVNNMAGVLDNPFKSKVLVTYLKHNPKHFVELLNGNVFNTDQLSKLNNLLKYEDGVTGANHNNEHFENYDQDYHQALDMLSQIVDRPGLAGIAVHHQQPQHQSMSPPVAMNRQPVYPAYAQMANSADKIANIMEERHQMDLAHQQAKKHRRFNRKIHLMNLNIRDDAIRIKQLEHELAEHKNILGLIMSRTGKCLGSVNNKGQITHTKHRGHGQPENGPVKIVMDRKKYQVNISNILKQHQFHNSTVKQLMALAAKDNNMDILGQCVNRNNKTIATIISYGNEKLYIPTVESTPEKTLPILAVIDAAASTKKSKKNKNNKKSKKNKDKKTECKDGSCAPGYKQELPAEAKTSWTKAIFGSKTHEQKQDELNDAKEKSRKANQKVKDLQQDLNK